MENRRIVGVSLVVAGVSVALLVFLTVAGSGGPPAVSEPDSPTLDSTVPDPYSGPNGERVATVQIGQNGGGLPIQIWNNNSVNRTISVELRHNASNSSLVERTTTLPSYGTLRLDLLTSSEYLLAVTDERTGTTEIYPVGPDKFDCNDRSMTVRVGDDGTIDARTVATQGAC